MGERLLKTKGAKLWNVLPSAVKASTISKCKDNMKDIFFLNFDHYNKLGGGLG